MPASHSILTILACAALCGLILVEAGYTGQHTTYPHEKTPENVAALQKAVHSWCNDSSIAEATYGHIKDWDTSGVTTMHSLFYFYCPTLSSFDEDLSQWDGTCRAARVVCFPPPAKIFLSSFCSSFHLYMNTNELRRLSD